MDDSFLQQENWNQQPQNMDQEGMSFGGGPPPGSVGSERAQMWQQSHYMVVEPQVKESGFASGCSTGPSSVISGYSGAASTFSGLDSLPQSELSSLASSQSIPAFEPDNSIPKLIENLSDNDPIVVDESFKSLEGYSRSDKFKQAITTHRMSDELTMCLSRELTRAAKCIMPVQENHQDSQEIERMRQRAMSASKVLSILSRQKASRSIIIESDALSAFSFFLNSTDRLRIYAITTVHNIVMDMDKPTSDEQECSLRAKAMETLRHVTSIEALCKMLHDAAEQGNKKLMPIVMDCLRILCIKSAETKQRLLRFGIPQLVVKVLSGDLQEASEKNLIKYTLHLLKTLSLCVDNKEAIICSGGIAAMSKYLGCNSEMILMYCAYTLRNLSDSIHKFMLNQRIPADSPDILFTIGQLVRLLDHKNPDLFTVAADVIFNLVVNKDACKMEFFKVGGIPTLTNILINWEQQTDQLSSRSAGDLMVAVIGTLRCVTNGYPMAAQAQGQLLSVSPDIFMCLLNLIKCLTKSPHRKQDNCCPVHLGQNVLSHCSDNKMVAPGGGWIKAHQWNQRHQSSWGPIRDILCLMRNFAQYPNCQAELCRQNAVSNLVDLANFIKTILPTDYNLSNSPSPPKEVLAAEVCLDILIYVSKDLNNWPNKITMPKFINTLIGYIKMSHESLSHRCVRILKHLTFDQNLAKAIKDNNECIGILKRLVASGNNSISDDAIQCLFNVSNTLPSIALDHHHHQQQQQQQQQQPQQHQYRPVPPLTQQQNTDALHQQGFLSTQQQQQMGAAPMQQQQLQQQQQPPYPNHGPMQLAQGFDKNQPAMALTGQQPYHHQQQQQQQQQQHLGYTGVQGEFPQQLFSRVDREASSFDEEMLN